MSLHKIQENSDQKSSLNTGFYQRVSQYKNDFISLLVIGILLIIAGTLTGIELNSMRGFIILGCLTSLGFLACFYSCFVYKTLKRENTTKPEITIKKNNDLSKCDSSHSQSDVVHVNVDSNAINSSSSATVTSTSSISSSPVCQNRSFLIHWDRRYTQTITISSTATVRDLFEMYFSAINVPYPAEELVFCHEKKLDELFAPYHEIREIPISNDEAVPSFHILILTRKSFRVTDDNPFRSLQRPAPI